MKAVNKIRSRGFDGEQMLKSPKPAPEIQSEKLLLSPVPQKGNYLCRFTPELNGRAFIDIEDGEEHHAANARTEVHFLLRSYPCQVVMRMILGPGAGAAPMQTCPRDHSKQSCASVMITW